MATQSMESSKTSRRLASFIPILSWLPRYNRPWLAADIIAGLTLWGLVVPEGMAYAGIAGLPPQAGLYTLVASLLVYALFGTSRHLSVGATSATAALIASTVVALGATTADMPTYQAYAAALVLVIGVVFLVAGLARLGWVTQFLSKPVMDGFVFGLAIFVAVGQLNKLFGVEKGEGNVFRKIIRRHQTASRSQLGDVCSRRGGPGAAVSAAALEQEDPSRSGGAVRLDRSQPCPQPERSLRGGRGGGAAAGAALGSPASGVRWIPVVMA